MSDYIRLMPKRTKARTTHRCMWCENIIVPGEIYMAWHMPNTREALEYLKRRGGAADRDCMPYYFHFTLHKMHQGCKEAHGTHPRKAYSPRKNEQAEVSL